MDVVRTADKGTIRYLLRVTVPTDAVVHILFTARRQPELAWLQNLAAH